MGLVEIADKAELLAGQVPIVGKELKNCVSRITGEIIMGHYAQYSGYGFIIVGILIVIVSSGNGWKAFFCILIGFILVVYGGIKQVKAITPTNIMIQGAKCGSDIAAILKNLFMKVIKGGDDHINTSVEENDVYVMDTHPEKLREVFGDNHEGGGVMDLVKKTKEAAVIVDNIKNLVMSIKDNAVLIDLLKQVTSVKIKDLPSKLSNFIKEVRDSRLAIDILCKQAKDTNDTTKTFCSHFKEQSAILAKIEDVAGMLKKIYEQHK